MTAPTVTAAEVDAARAWLLAPPRDFDPRNRDHVREVLEQAAAARRAAALAPSGYHATFWLFDEVTDLEAAAVELAHHDARVRTLDYVTEVERHIIEPLTDPCTEADE